MTLINEDLICCSTTDGVTLYTASRGLRFRVGVLCSRIDAPTLNFSMTYMYLAQLCFFSGVCLLTPELMSAAAVQPRFVGLMIRINTSPIRVN